MHSLTQATPTLHHGTYTANPLKQCQWLDFSVMNDARGNLSVIESHRHIPFAIERVFYVYDIPAMAERAGHAHRDLIQVLIPMSGGFDLHMDDGVEQRSVHLNRANRGYLVRPWTWCTLDNFSGSSVCLVLASSAYDESDYIRSFADFQNLAEQRKGMYQ